MIQTWAMLLDSYRELNHRRLFWIALVLSGFGVLAFACVGINEEGLTILTWTLETRFFNSTVLAPDVFYKLVFVNLGINFWLSWLATILALVSTAGMIPDLVSSGSIDLMVSKPLSRARLFLTKFAGGLLFTALQVTAFTAASFLVIGLRGGTWEPGLFLAVPIVVLFYSYLFAFCALIGLVTRSTVASLLLTLLFWAFIAGLWGASQAVNAGRISSVLELKAIDRMIEEKKASRGVDADVAKLEEDRAGQMQSQWRWDTATGILDGVVWALPKTTATIELLERQLIELADLPGGNGASREPPVFGTRRVRERDLMRAVQEHQRSISVTWIIGTSVGFEIVVLGLAVLIFSRRDY